METLRMLNRNNVLELHRCAHGNATPKYETGLGGMLSLPGASIANAGVGFRSSVSLDVMSFTI